MRVRTLDTFPYSSKYLRNQYGDVVDSLNSSVPIIEANLERMEPTLKHLPPQYQDTRYMTGGYISTDIGSSISFIENIDVDGKKKKPTLILEQQTPFILINIAVPKLDYTDKEHVVIGGFYDHMLNEEEVKSDQKLKSNVSTMSLLAQVKHLMYVGYPFEEVCSILLSPAKTITQLLNAGQRLLSVANTLSKEGYKNPADIPYYITFKINPSTFAIDIKSIMSGDDIDPKKQIGFFKIIEFDKDNSFIIIETPLFLTAEMCQKILKAESSPVITRYNPSMKTIDVKSNGDIFKEFKRNNSIQVAKIKALNDFRMKKTDVDYDGSLIKFRSDDSSRGVSISNPNSFNIRKLSEYYYAADQIKEVCADWNRKNPEDKVEFKDIDIFIGPIEKIMGQGTQGGYMDADSFAKNKLKVPFEIIPGLFISPPLIAVNSATKPSYAQQTDTLVHEYSHNLYSITHPQRETPEYLREKGLQQKDVKKWFYLYMTDPDERLAHKYQIKHLLMSGVTPDEIIREKVGGVVSADNYGMAMKYKELVDEAIQEVDQDKVANEKPTRENIEEDVPPMEWL